MEVDLVGLYLRYGGEVGLDFVFRINNLCLVLCNLDIILSFFVYMILI